MSDTREMTVQQWLDLQPTTDEMEAANNRPKEEAQAHKELILALFDGIDKGKMASLITDAVGALYVAEPAYAVKVCQHLYDVLRKDLIFGGMPPAIRQLLEAIANAD